MKQEIYILTHKKLDYDIDLNGYTPIQVGAHFSDQKIYDTADNDGEDNISYKNKYYLETTGIYWIWKNSDADIKGQMQFRRFLAVNPNFVGKILENYDIITASPIRMNVNIEAQYENVHNLNDLLIVENIINVLYPDYSESYVKYIRNNPVIYYSNSFICKKETYSIICNFIFSILKMHELITKIHNDTIRHKYAEDIFNNNKYLHSNESNGHTEISKIEYQERISAYLFERLFTLFIFHNMEKYGLKVYECGNYIKMEENMKL